MYKCQYCNITFYDDEMGVKCDNPKAAPWEQEFEECCPKCGCTDVEEVDE